MKVGNSKLFRKIYLNRRSNPLMDMIDKKEPCEIAPIKEWWKARNVKDTQ